MWEMEDDDLEAVGVPVDMYAGCGDMVRRGEGVETRNDEFPYPRSCVKAGGEAGENSHVEGVLEVQLQAEPSNELGGVRLPLLPLGGRRGEALSSSEDGFQLQPVELPL